MPLIVRDQFSLCVLMMLIWCSDLYFVPLKQNVLIMFLESVFLFGQSSYPIWEDFITKAGKLQSQLRATVVAAAAFLDAFQKVADLATSTRGGTRDIGSALTRMCMRHRSIEAKLRQFSMAFIDCLINPLQEQMEEWKRGVNTLDKDHAKEHKKARSEIKKRSLDTLKLQKKAKKGRGDVQPQLHNAMQDVSDKYLLLEETEKQAVRKALIEERSRFCAFVSMLRPVVDEEISMLGEVTHLQTISDDLKVLTLDPHKLPPTSEQVILDLKGSDCNWSFQTPPSSPSTMSRKSSMCSVNSSDSRSSDTPHSHPPSPCYRYRSSTLPQQAPARLSSVSSHDSGFISQLDAYTSKSPSPMPQETLPQPCSSSGSSETSETCQSVSGGSSPTSSGSGGPLASADKVKKHPPPLAPPPPPPPKGTPVSRYHRDLALALTQGLQQGAQRSSRDSLQCSSGYSTQSTTPCCSEDTIPSQVSDYDYFSMGGDQEVDQQEFDKSSTIPRNSDISQSYRRMFQSKRPASTAGLPSTAGPVITSPGVATIRRTPSTKPSARRGATGPIPIRTPVIPVQMPAVPGPAGGVRVAFPGGLELGAEEPEEDRSPDSAQGDLGMLPLASWRGQASTNPPPAQLSPHQPGVQEQDEPGPLEVGEVGGTVDGQGENMLLAIQRGVKLRRTNTNDRSAPRIA
uniref:MTSS I-BAR domain containing 1 n=1 Tax=Esox lucius TaxID=8010 RepID=A0A6Q2ZMR6_ESOLU